MGRALRALAAEGRDGFYQGEFAAGLDLPDDPADPLWAHLLAESARIAGHDRPAVLHEHAEVGQLLEAAAIEGRRARIDPNRRAAVADLTAAGDTTYLCAVDAWGSGVSLIQSNAAGFGSGLFEPATGINLHNRGIGFSLTPGQARYGPGRRPPHTLAPTLVTRQDGVLRALAGTMGGDAQPQVMLQVLTRVLRHGTTAAEAIDAPRWRIGPGATAPGWADGLAARGHRVNVLANRDGTDFGHAHLIDVLGDRGVHAAADPRSGIGAAVPGSE